MSVDKLVDSTQLDSDLTSVANAIRTKGGTSAQLAFPSGFVSAIQNIPTGGGSGVTRLASGTFTGGGTYEAEFSVGTKMAQTDFYIKIWVTSGTEFQYDANYKFAVMIATVLSGITHFNLSQNGTRKTPIADLSYNLNNSGTITTVTGGKNASTQFNVRNGSFNENTFNQCKITRANDGFKLYIAHSNNVYKFVSGMTYNYEVVYFGSNPSTDIVEVS